MLVAGVDRSVAGAARRKRQRRLILCLQTTPAVAAEHAHRGAELNIDFPTGLVRMVREILKDRVVVRRARQVRIRQSVKHRAGE